MCGLCQDVNPFVSDCFLDHGDLNNPLWQSVSETADAVNSVGAFGGGYHIAAGDEFHGHLSADDVDVVAITLTQGQDYTFSVSPSDAEWDDVLDSHLSLLDANGATVASNDDINYSANNFYSAFNFTAQETGTYYLSVTTYRTYYSDLALARDVGHYTLRAESQGAAVGVQEFSLTEIAHQLSHAGWGNATYKWDVSPGGSISVNLTGLTFDGQTLARAALEAWTAVLGINFQETSASAQMTFDDNNNGAYANFSTSGGSISTATINVSTSWISAYGTGLNSYSFQTYIHEVGHALGLAHAGNYNGSATFGTDNHYQNDSWQTSIMSYFSQTENTFVDASYAYVITPQIADILAGQSLYGSAQNLRMGDTTYGANSTAGGYYDQIASLSNTAFTILDDGGIDTFDTSSFNAAQSVDLRAERFSDVFGEIGNMAIARGTVLENFMGGSGADTVLGNTANNIISGNNGNDVVYGDAGDDQLFGGAGDDRLVGNAGNDTLDGGDGADILKGKDGDNTLIGGVGDDKLTGADSGDDTFFGGDGFDILLGLDGMDTLDGGAGADLMYGGLGDDSLSGGDDADRLRGNRNNDTLNGGAGSDSLYGGNNDDSLSGNEDRDFLLGEGGNDRLDGGTGNDNLTGGAGADVFVFNTGYGFDRISDFEDGVDLIDLTHLNLNDVSDLFIADTGQNVRINFGGGDVLYLENLQGTDLQNTDFLF